MFNCETCGHTSKPNEKANRIVADVRLKTYFEHTPPTQGEEIVKEITICDTCLNLDT